MNTLKFDLLIFGGGIAGLWTLLRARHAGYQALLLESDSLGGVQSIASQGIIHGGTKYALKGKLGASARAISDMPAIWTSALNGDGEIDLSHVRILSAHQYLWSSGSLGSSLASAFASKLMQSRVKALAKNELPAPFDAPEFHGSLYRLQEPVLDTASLMATLAEQALPYCYQYDPSQMHINDGEIHVANALLQPRQVLLTAGQGNASLMASWGLEQPAMQTRPLHMVMLKGDLPPVYAHCLGVSSNPRLTITSYPLADEQVWYLGGQLAEEGVKRNEQEQIAQAKSELKKLLPWMCFERMQWATLRIQRAEVETPGGKRPHDCYLGGETNIRVAWPTKLAFAPRLAEQVLQQLQPQSEPSAMREQPTLDLPKPPLAALPWEKISLWN